MRRRALSELEDRPFDEQDLTDDPLELFTRWFEDARSRGAAEPNAMALATATPEGEPSARMVLMNGFDDARAHLLHRTTTAAREASSS